MAYSITLANRVREYLAEIPHITVEEKAMFGGLAGKKMKSPCANSLCGSHHGEFCIALSTISIKLFSFIKFFAYLCTRFKNKLYEQLLQYP